MSGDARLSTIAARGGPAGRIAAALALAVQGGRLGQTYLIFGPTGAGKMELARALTAAAACQEPLAGDACGRCHACAAGTSGAEADLAVLAPPDGKREILIDQVRLANEELRLAPMVGRTRALIIDGADRLRDEAANALLKTLEEPPERALVLLLTARPEAVLPTIRSRALEVRLPVPVATDAAAADGAPEAEAARALLDDDPASDPFDRAARAVALVEQAAGEDDRETVGRPEKLRRAALAALDRASGLVRESFRRRALGGQSIQREERAVLSVGLAAERIEANATPKLVFEVLALELEASR